MSSGAAVSIRSAVPAGGSGGSVVGGSVLAGSVVLVVVLVVLVVLVLVLVLVELELVEVGRVDVEVGRTDVVGVADGLVVADAAEASDVEPGGRMVRPDEQPEVPTAAATSPMSPPMASRARVDRLTTTTARGRRARRGT